MNRVAGSCILIFLVAVAGCASQQAPTPAWSDWAARQGGLAQVDESARAAAALQRLGPPHLDTTSHSFQVHVLNADRPCAYVWPSGSLFVTRGLLQLLDDEELTGALAHEIGHLAGSSPRFKSAAFSGNGSTNCEIRADAAGCELLTSAGLSPECLARALSKVRDDPRTPASLRSALSQRIQIIRGAH